MMNNFTIDNWIKRRKIEVTIKSDFMKKKLTLFKASILAILFGLALGAIVVYAAGYDGIAYIFKLFEVSFDTTVIPDSGFPSSFNQTMCYFVAYMLMGLGLAIGFKVGIFNMGGSGQAILGLGVSSLAIQNYADAHNIAFSEVPSWFVINVILIFIVVGVMLSTIAGLLKVFFNIHEVVTTVMLNWVAFYLIKWLLLKDLVNGYSPLVNADWLSWGTDYSIGLIVAIASILIMWAVMTFTTFGYKFKMVGSQPDAARYAGIKNRLYLIITTSLQGLFMGLGVMFYYMQIDGQIQFSSEAVPSVGFDAIAIALVAFNNFFGIIPVAMLWAVFKNGSDSANDGAFSGLSPNISGVMFGTIIYGAAIFILFVKFQPWKWVKQWLYWSKDYATQYLIKDNKQKIKEIKARKDEALNSSEIQKLKQIVDEKKAKMMEIKNNTELKTQELNQYMIEFEKANIELQKEKTAYKNEIKNSSKIKANKIHAKQLSALSAEVRKIKKYKFKSFAIAKEEYETALDEYKFEIKTQKDIIEGSIKLIKNENKIIFENGEKKYASQSDRGIKAKFVSLLSTNLISTLDEIVYFVIHRDAKIDKWKKEYKSLLKTINNSGVLLNKQPNKEMLALCKAALTEMKNTHKSEMNELMIKQKSSMEDMIAKLDQGIKENKISKFTRKAEIKKINAIIAEPIVELKMKQLDAMKQLEIEHISKVYSSDFAKAVKLKTEIKYDSENLKNQANLSGIKTVYSYELYKSERKIELNKNVAEAKTHMKQLKENLKTDLSNSKNDKLKVREIKTLYINKVLEVGEKYGRFN